jgi:hypothetical protein
VRQILARRIRRVKSTRRTGYPDAPFGFGLGMPEPTPGPPRPQRYIPLAVACPESFSLDPVEAAWAARQFADAPECGAHGGIACELAMQERDGAEVDRMAAERLWEQAYEAGLTAQARCSLCGLIPDGGALTSGLCDGCSDLVDMGVNIVPCCSCGRSTDGAAPYCDRCDVPAVDDSSQGSQYLAATGRRMTV